MDYFESVFRQTPLEIITGVLLRFPHLEKAAAQILGSYDEFLGILSDEGQRRHLESLSEEMAETDDVYQRARELSHKFRAIRFEMAFCNSSLIHEVRWIP